MRSHRLVTALAGIAVASLALTACSGGGTDASADAAKESLTVVRPDEPITLDWKNGGDMPDVFILGNVMESLTKMDVEAGEAVPSLATNWTVSDDLLTWDFELRDGVTFHNGEPFNADSVVYSLQTLIDGVDLKKHGSVSMIETVEKVDESNVRITLNAPDGVFDRRLSRIEIADPTFDQEHLNDADSNVNGTGPFQLTGWTRGEKVELERFDDYWGGVPAIEDVTVLWRAESSVRASMVSTGEADLAWDISPTEQVPVQESQVTYNLVWMRIDTDGDNPALADERVRFAMRSAADMETASTTIFNDVVSVIGGNQNVPHSATGYIDDLPVWEFDMEAAAELVAEAAADGVDVTVPIRINLRNGGGQFPGDAEFAEYLVEQWREIGLTGAEVQSLETSQWVTAHTTVGEGQPHAELSYAATDINFLDYSQQYRYLACDGRYSLYCDPETDRLLTEAGAKLGEERSAAYEELGEYLEPKVPMFNFGVLTQYFGLAEGLSWMPDGREYPLFADMSWSANG